MKTIEQTLLFSIWVFPSFGVYQWSRPEVLGPFLWCYILFFVCCLVLLLSGPFAVMACIGTRLGQLFGRFKPLTAYGINLLGSIGGSLIFSLLAFTGASPWMLLIPPIAAICVFVRANIWTRVIPAIVAIALAAWVPHLEPGKKIYWSPYQRLDVTDVKLSPNATDDWSKNQGITIKANGHFYQYAFDLSDKNLTRQDMPAEARQRLEQHSHHYNLPYKLIHPKTVLILGAGSGNDVAAALRHGAEHVDAVDIDPVILDLGIHHHPERPYDSQKVTIYCDDARDFLNQCKNQYDLIVFGGLDSHTVIGQGSSMRLDNFVYTKESMEQAISHLNKDGLMFLSFCQARRWLTRRLFETIKAAATYDPGFFVDSSSPELPWEIFVVGEPIRNKQLQFNDIAPFTPETPQQVDYSHILTDDWPFVYVTPVGLDVPYLIVVFSLLVLAVVPARRVLWQKDPELWQMFFLGSAFILLELQAIGRLALLYGSTWMTSSLVINGVLLMIFAANYLVSKVGDRLPIRMAYILLFVALLISYGLPIRAFIGLPMFLGHALVTLVTVAPMFMAGIVFPLSFRQAKEPQRAYGFNLLGAVLGAMLEYASNYVGINNLVLVAVVLYGLSMLFYILKWPQQGAPLATET